MGPVVGGRGRRAGFLFWAGTGGCRARSRCSGGGGRPALSGSYRVVDPLNRLRLRVRLRLIQDVRLAARDKQTQDDHDATGRATPTSCGSRSACRSSSATRWGTKPPPPKLPRRRTVALEGGVLELSNRAASPRRATAEGYTSHGGRSPRCGTRRAPRRPFDPAAPLAALRAPLVPVKAGICVQSARIENKMTVADRRQVLVILGFCVCVMLGASAGWHCGRVRVRSTSDCYDRRPPAVLRGWCCSASWSTSRTGGSR